MGKRWTDEEKSLVSKGQVPESRTYAQAAAYAHAHGIPWRELRAPSNTWYWSDEEKATLARGEIPPGRTEAACRQARRMLRIKAAPPRVLSRDELRAAVSGHSQIPARELERRCRRAGLAMPAEALPAESHRRMRAEALAQGKSYVRKQFLSGPMSRGEYIWLLHESGISYSEIGRRLKITGTRAQSLASIYESKPA